MLGSPGSQPLLLSASKSCFISITKRHLYCSPIRNPKVYFSARSGMKTKYMFLITNHKTTGIQQEMSHLWSTKENPCSSQMWGALSFLVWDRVCDSQFAVWSDLYLVATGGFLLEHWVCAHGTWQIDQIRPVFHISANVSVYLTAQAQTSRIFLIIFPS